MNIMKLQVMLLEYDVRMSVNITHNYFIHNKYHLKISQSEKRL